MLKPRIGFKGLMLVAGSSVVGCATPPEIAPPPPPPEPIVAVDPGEAIQLVPGRAKLLGLSDLPAGMFIDVRDEEAFADGHIPGARPIARIEFSGHGLPDPGSCYPDLLIVYGADYGDERVEAAAIKLSARRTQRILILRGGLLAWKAAGNRVETE